MTKVWVTAQFEGLHFWPEAPEEVFFLRHPHRHIFHTKVTVLTNSDREVEFFLLKKDVKTVICIFEKMGSCSPREQVAPLIPYSCEKMAEHIFLELKKLGYNVCEVEVNEDSENGTIFFMPHTTSKYIAGIDYEE